MTARTKRLLLLVAGVCLAASDTIGATGGLGRLFFTPERRATLDRQRQFNIQEVRTLEGATVSLDGIVRRSSGKTTVWVNRQPLQDNAGASGVTVAVSPRDPGRAVVTPGDEAPTTLQVGQSLNRATRETSDGLGGGRVAVSRSASK
jgi:hypothetical protein